ncbi:MAG: aminotransferase class V-fold PLP-dependent enzyme, partial [Ignavibacteriae bacterium]|nr:aminotransferase class V-fold PLP-dependent enzyme [Ignavibacteriota bacterium]
AGTKNVASIVDFAEAVKKKKKNMEDNFNKVSSLKTYFIDKLKSNFDEENILINSKGNSTPYILSFTLNPDLYKSDSQAMLMNLDVNGIAASSGSACASGTIKPSHVILASGKSAEYANGTLRFSFNAENIFEEIDYTIDILSRMFEKFKK